MRPITRVLQKLSHVVDYVTEDIAKDIISDFSTKLAQEIDADIVSVRWKEKAQNADILDPFYSSKKAESYVINTNPVEKTGIWTWLCEKEKPVWLEDIPNLDLDSSIQNKATDDEIGPRYLTFSKGSRSIMATPMKFHGVLCGVFSMEWFSPNKPTESSLELMEETSKYFARIIKKAKLRQLKEQDTARVAELFRRSIEKLGSKQKFHSERIGFIARPFEPDSIEVETCIKSHLNANEVDIEHFTSVSSKAIVISKIMEKITKSHFCIVDITGCSPNVLLELGMMLALDKELLILQDSEDRTEIPFDLQAYHCYKYKIQRESAKDSPYMEIFSPAKSKFESIEPTLVAFIERLKKKPSFAEANPWRT